MWRSNRDLRAPRGDVRGLIVPTPHIIISVHFECCDPVLCRPRQKKGAAYFTPQIIIQEILA